MTSVYKQLIAIITIGGVGHYMGKMLFSIGAEYQHLSGFGLGLVILLIGGYWLIQLAYHLPPVCICTHV